MRTENDEEYDFFLYFYLQKRAKHVDYCWQYFVYFYFLIYFIYLKYVHFLDKSNITKVRTRMSTTENNMLVFLNAILLQDGGVHDSLQIPFSFLPLNYHAQLSGFLCHQYNSQLLSMARALNLPCCLTIAERRKDGFTLFS